MNNEPFLSEGGPGISQLCGLWLAPVVFEDAEFNSITLAKVPLLVHMQEHIHAIESLFKLFVANEAIAFVLS